MKNQTPLHSFLRASIFALGCACALALVSTSARAEVTAEKSAKLPVSATFEKVPGGERGQFVLKVKNDSAESLKVHAKILLAVAFHADNKARHVPEHAIAAGETWTISDLALEDKVILTAKGYAPLELVVK